MEIKFSKEIRKHIAAIIAEGPEEETVDVLRYALALYIRCRRANRCGGKVIIQDSPDSLEKEIVF